MTLHDISVLPSVLAAVLCGGCCGGKDLGVIMSYIAIFLFSILSYWFSYICSRKKKEIDLQ